MLVHNHSPWIRQLRRSKKLAPLSRDMRVDVVIVGAGIAGISTAYQILTQTDQSVLLVEGDKVAHGATGHNAGQIASYFERALYDMAEEYGVKATCEAQRDVESGWEVLEGIIEQLGIQDTCWTFMGYAGCSDFEQVIHYLKSNKVRREGGLPLQKLMIAETSEWLGRIPEEFAGLYEQAAHREILEKLNTDDTAFQALLESKKGCTNSAVFCEEILQFMQKKYWDRFQCVERTPVDVIDLHKDLGHCHTKSGFVATGKHIVLCTNGFEHFRIENRAGDQIDARFHMEVEGKVGLMAAYIEKTHREPTAISYFPTNAKDPSEDAYFYLTRRPYRVGNLLEQTLLSVGGPDYPLLHHTYSRKEPYVKEFERNIDAFLQKTYKHHPKNRPEYAYLWHGLMGYTQNRLRLIGHEPANSVLLYNLGCNGVGILPSLFGGHKIAGLLAGREYAPSLFDPFICS